MKSLTDDEIARYGRQIIVPGVGGAGQERLKKGSVLVVGAGGLGSPSLMYLAAAGVGRIGIIDADDVDVTNLQRQVAHATTDVGRNKAESASETIRAINPLIQVVTYPERLTPENGLEILAGYDVVLDGSDNFPTRYLANDACVLLGRPLVTAAILRYSGQISIVRPHEGPCYRCIFPEPPAPGSVPSCSQAGILGPVAGVMGSLQALEAIKLVLGEGTPLIGRLVVFDALGLHFRELRLAKDPECPVCGLRPAITEPVDYEAFCAGVGHDAVEDAEISSRDLAAALQDRAGSVQIVDVREPWEWELARIEGASLLPLGELPGRLAEVDPRVDIVTVCHHGLRSLHARELLRAAGFTRVRSLAGGIDQWARDVEPDMARY